MNNSSSENAVLLLEDGTFFYGKSAGAKGTSIGEICFNTSMTGYQEIFTDPSYYKQSIIMTNVHIGNYGVSDFDVESNSVKISGLIARNISNLYSRKMASSNLNEYLVKNGITAIHNIDTRALVLHIRSKGAMNCIISNEIFDFSVLNEKLKEALPMEGLELSSEVSTKEAYYFGNENAAHKIAALDFGIKTNILRSLAARDCYIKVFPAKTSFEELLQFNPKGFFISNGPGDPAAMPYAVETVKKCIASDLPNFGICLGNQLLALAIGVPTYKMHNGHRGGNHPVKNLKTGKCEITSQNHGFAVNFEALQNHKDAEITHVNLNDHTIEGFRIKNSKTFSVQYHPESSPGPHDSRYLFDDFVQMLA